MTKDTLDIWASATDLSEYFQGLIDKNPIDEDSIWDQLGGAPEKLSSNPTTLELFARHTKILPFDRIHNDEKLERRERLISEIIRSFVKGEFVLFGRTFDEAKQAHIAEIDRTYWIAATINPEECSASDTHTKYDELRIVSQAKKLTPEASETETHGPNREAQIMRMEAISHCVAKGLVELSGGPRSRRNRENNLMVRAEKYRTYLGAAYEKDFEELEGFADKSFERSEIKFKKQNNEEKQTSIVPQRVRD